MHRPRRAAILTALGFVACGANLKETAGRSLQALKGVGESYDRKVADWYKAEAGEARRAVAAEFSDCHVSPERGAACWTAYDRRMAKANAVLDTWREGLLKAIRAAQDASLAELQNMPDKADQESEELTAARTLLRVALQNAYEYLRTEGVPVEAP